ncbi:hypothetical protein MVLG_06349 [Microbotryum lychnidis-dioicae p1A1 Lamole]|uniref:Luciferase-like domain-containing protein n=1 Tax=Microbotryum lychnidis-dioicae (strain p1A1 Lamole / MvSl-1064) TaxID=683840 RepID=U5HH06_USTV1|nr:hypothetical protein MVLG_06349 [Microbotryum lychnidis-dioicae p1A1 Lamole]|eukprot:KDE03154.1 hypothetical protein MVLG_06349 [Microbotryum lychnidis-dioicae p1A1 Lamole]
MQSYESTATPLPTTSMTTPTSNGRAPRPSSKRTSGHVQNGSAVKKRWILNAFDMACAGHQTPGLWKHPLDRSAQYHTLEYWTELAKLLERGKFNGIFIADTLGAYDVYNNNPDAAARTGAQWGVDDPTLLISACALVTKNLSFGITQSVTYEHPYTVARKFATLDHLTKGRVAINAVTSYLTSAARSYGLTDQIEHDERYARAEEYFNVLYKLWESSWRDDAVILDKARDLYADPSRIRKIHHEGKYFKCEGPALVEPSPQGTPLVYQAGSSSAGLAFGARHAEAVFMSGPSPAKIRIQVDALRDLVEKEGRPRDSIKVLVKLLVIVAETDELAQSKHDEYYALASREGAKVLFGGWIGQDLGLYAPDADLREVGTPPVKGVARGYAALFPEVEKWTADVLGDHIKVGGMGYAVVGSPKTVADQMQQWIDETDCDGFNLCYAITPGTFEDIVNLLVPELQRRGVHWTDYPQRPDGQGITAREGIYGVGEVKLDDRHYGAQYKWRAGQDVPPSLEKPGSLISADSEATETATAGDSESTVNGKKRKVA